MFHFLFLFILCWGHYSICKLVRSIFFIKQTPSRFLTSCLRMTLIRHVNRSNQALRPTLF
ncbi:hypothetical protein V6Z12_D12G240000 [Gossypium hirsutum]